MHRALGDRGCVVLINFRASHEQRCHPLELAVVAGHHINSGEPPDHSSCFGDHSLAKTAFQIRGRVFDGMGCDQIGEIEHGPIIRHASCHLLRGKLAISQGSVRNLLSATTLRATVLNCAIVLKRVCASCPPTTPCAHDIAIATDQRGYTPTDGGAVTPTDRRALRRRSVSGKTIGPKLAEVRLSSGIRPVLRSAGPPRSRSWTRRLSTGSR